MKKSLLILSLILVATTSFAQGGRAERKAKQAAEQAKFDAQMVAAIESGSFTFVAEYMNQNFGENYPINGPYTRFYIVPGQLNVLLPYFTSTQPMAVAPLSIDFSATQFKYSYTLRKGMYYAKIVVNNVINNQANNKVQSGRYVFEFEISPITGNAFLTVTPNYNASINYTGIVRPNN